MKATKPAQQAFQPTLGERLTALMHQLRAVLAILINQAGQVVERAGSVDEISANPALLAALMDSFRASHIVSDALGRESTESLHSFTYGRQRIYMAPVDTSNALLVVLTGYFEPDKLGMIDRAIHLAVHDLQLLLERAREAETLKPGKDDAAKDEPQGDIVIDEEALAVIENMFSQAPKEGGKEKADGFWETLGEKGALDGKSGKDVLSYDEAQNLGLAPDGEQE